MTLCRPCRNLDTRRITGTKSLRLDQYPKIFLTLQRVDPPGIRLALLDLPNLGPSPIVNRRMSYSELSTYSHILRWLRITRELFVTCHSLGISYRVSLPHWPRSANDDFTWRGYLFRICRSIRDIFAFLFTGHNPFIPKAIYVGRVIDKSD